MLASLRIGALLCLAALIGVLVYVNRRGVDVRQAVSYRVLLRAVQREDNALRAELLRASFGSVNHYDTLVRRTKARKHYTELLAEAPTYLDEAGRDELERAVRGEPDENAKRLGGLLASLERQNDMVEDFKFHHAVLRHSVRYLPFAAQTLVRDATLDNPQANLLTTQLNALFTEVLLYNEFGASHRQDEIRSQIDAVRRQNVGFLPEDQQKAIRLLARHAELILDKKEQVDEALEEIGRVPVANHLEQVRRVFERNHEAVARRTIQLRYAAFILSLLTIALGAAFIIMRMKHAASLLTSAKGELEAANAALEREKDKEKELAELKSRFVSMTSHEFRTPLTVIGSSAELLKSYGDKWDGEKRHKHFAKIKTATSQMKRMLDEVLLVGKAEAGMLRFEPRAIDVSQLVSDVVDELQTDVHTSHTIEVNLDDEVGEGVLDERLLRHLVNNLLTNAMKYSPDAARVFLDVKVVDDELVFVVEDTGLGIAPYDLDRLFESYYRGDNVGTIKGTGLGLALVKTAVDQHSGTITIESEVGQGTTFTVHIPLDAAALAEQRESHAAP